MLNGLNCLIIDLYHRSEKNRVDGFIFLILYKHRRQACTEEAGNFYWKLYLWHHINSKNSTNYNKQLLVVSECRIYFFINFLIKKEITRFSWLNQCIKFGFVLQLVKLSQFVSIKTIIYIFNYNYKKNKINQRKMHVEG